MFFKFLACDFSVNNVMPLLRDIGTSKFPDALMQKDQEAHPPAVMPKNIFPAIPSCETTERRISSEEAVGLIWMFTIYCIILILIFLGIAVQHWLLIPVQIIPNNVCQPSYWNSLCNWRKPNMRYCSWCRRKLLSKGRWSQFLENQQLHRPEENAEAQLRCRQLIEGGVGSISWDELMGQR